MFTFVYALTCLSILVAEFHAVFTFGRTICAPKLEACVQLCSCSATHV